MTSKGVGMAVPDWPTSFGYNMFALPISTWKTGGIFDEHTHRVWASTVGLLVVFLTRWIGGRESRKALAWIGGVELGVGLALFFGAGTHWKGESHFLMGIAGVVLLAAAVPFRSAPAPTDVIRLAWMAFWTVQVQGGLGGLRVVLDQWAVAGTTGGILFGVTHGCLGQLFFALVAAICFRLSPGWDPESWRSRSNRIPVGLARTAAAAVLGQLLLGLLMRHQHAGLAIPDLPLAHGQWWPATDPDALARYSARREGFDPITAFQVRIHMFHRLNALLATLLAVAVFVRTRGLFSCNPARHLSTAWLVLICVQFSLGVLTVLFDKPADIATAHVAVGTLTLATGILTAWTLGRTRSAAQAEGTQVTAIPQMTSPASAR